MVIALICAIPITAIVVGFFVLKSVQLGLKWQIQTTQKQVPELNTPINAMVEAVQQKQAENMAQYNKEKLQEWMFGGDK